ncbi:hypothetical protein WDU94_006215 [Cyamophila willieti]
MTCNLLVRLCSQISPCKKIVCLYLRARRGQLPPHLTFAFFSALVLFIIILFYLYALCLSRYGGRYPDSSKQDSSSYPKVEQGDSSQKSGTDEEVVRIPPPVYKRMVPVETCPKQQGYLSRIVTKEKSKDACSKCQQRLAKFLQMSPKCVTLRQLQTVIRNNLFEGKYNADEFSSLQKRGEDPSRNRPPHVTLDNSRQYLDKPLELPRKRPCRACSKRRRTQWESNQERSLNQERSDQLKGIVVHVVDYR